MSEREKKLLLFLGVTFFLILNFIGFNLLYLPAVSDAKNGKINAERKLQGAETVLALRDTYEPEMEWLTRSGTATTTPLVAQSKLQALLRKQASARQLEIRDSRIIPFQPGEHYDRVKVLFKVTGMERDVMSWLTSIHQVAQRQVVTKMELKPQNNNLTRIEVEVEVEKWIITSDDEA
ncbi:MAG: type II secretory pathway component PulM [Akkermansiaceae bacterium]|jgi:type II secretory pathway component PulM